MTPCQRPAVRRPESASRACRARSRAAGACRLLGLLCGIIVLAALLAARAPVTGSEYGWALGTQRRWGGRWEPENGTNLGGDGDGVGWMGWDAIDKMRRAGGPDVEPSLWSGCQNRVGCQAEMAARLGRCRWEGQTERLASEADRCTVGGGADGAGGGRHRRTRVRNSVSVGSDRLVLHCYSSWHALRGRASSQNQRPRSRHVFCASTTPQAEVDGYGSPLIGCARRTARWETGDRRVFRLGRPPSPRTPKDAQT